MAHQAGPRSVNEQATFVSANVISGIAAAAASSGQSDGDQNIIAIVFSAMWVEAGLNELLYHFASHTEDQVHPSLKEAHRAVIAADLYDSRTASVQLKLRILSASTTGQQLNFGKAPWQDLSLLLELRNWLIHMRPELMQVRPGQKDEPSMIVSRDVHKLVTALKGAGAITEVPSGHLVPVVIAAGLPGVGHWAYRTAYTVLADVGTWHPAWRSTLLLAAREPK